MRNWHKLFYFHGVSTYMFLFKSVCIRLKSFFLKDESSSITFYISYVMGRMIKILPFRSLLIQVLKRRIKEFQNSILPWRVRGIVGLITIKGNVFTMPCIAELISSFLLLYIILQALMSKIKISEVLFQTFQFVFK